MLVVWTNTYKKPIQELLHQNNIENIILSIITILEFIIFWCWNEWMNEFVYRLMKNILMVFHFSVIWSNGDHELMPLPVIQFTCLMCSTEGQK
jgi:hypothetical protein